MKAFNIIKLIFVLSIIQMSKTYAQKDYVITKKHDTIFCKIKANFGQHSEYKINGEEKYQEIDTVNVIRFYVDKDGSTWVLKILPLTKKQIKAEEGYVKWLEKGRINLFEYVSGTLTSVSMGYQHTPVPGSSGVSYRVGAGTGNKEPEISWAFNKGDDTKQLNDIGFKIGGKLTPRRDGLREIMNLMADNPGLLGQLKDSSDNGSSYEIVREAVAMYNQQYLFSNKPPK